MGFPRQEYWSGLPFPSPGDLLHSGIEPASSTLAGSLYHGVTWEPHGGLRNNLVLKEHEDPLPLLCRPVDVLSALFSFLTGKEGQKHAFTLFCVRSALATRGRLSVWNFKRKIHKWLSNQMSILVFFFFSSCHVPCEILVSQSGIEPRSLTLQADSLSSEPPGKPLYKEKQANSDHSRKQC